MTESPYIQESFNLSLEDTAGLAALLEFAKQLAQPPISGFRVGAVAIGQSGRAYLGVNLEFEGMPLSQTVHAEQFALALAKQNDETALQHLIVSAMPCGHCRQFLLELGQPDLPITIIKAESRLDFRLADLLPYPFTLAHSGQTLFSITALPSSFSLPLPEPQADALKQAFQKAYAPYTKSPSIILLQASSGACYTGFALESAAYNPTLPPLQVAIVQLIANNVPPTEISEVLLIEPVTSRVSYARDTEALAAKLFPGQAFQCKPEI